MSDPFAGGGFDAPESLPGFSVNAGVPGAHAGPLGGGPVIDTKEIEANASAGTDRASAQMDPSAVAALDAANTSMSTNAIKGMQAAVNQLKGVSADPQLQRPQDRPEPSIPSGYMGAVVPGADASLISALQSAASSAGPQAALMAPTVIMQL